MTAQETLDLIPYWQKVLRLQDWDIQGEITKRTDGPYAQVRAVFDYKAAVITLLETDLIPDSWLGNQDPEVSLVHELLHLQSGSLYNFCHSQKEPWYHNDMETLLELTAIALVTLKRQTHGS